jgi:hypothetical protein
MAEITRILGNMITSSAKSAKSITRISVSRNESIGNMLVSKSVNTRNM